jgi:hypothetical protein
MDTNPRRQPIPELDEQEIQRAIVEHQSWRAHPDTFCFHVSLGGYRRPTEAAILKSIGTIAGSPEGRCYALELKTERGRVTEVQRVTHERLRRASAEVAVAFGLDHALATLERWRILRGRSQQ